MQWWLLSAVHATDSHNSMHFEWEDLIVPTGTRAKVRLGYLVLHPTSLLYFMGNGADNIQKVFLKCPGINSVCVLLLSAHAYLNGSKSGEGREERGAILATIACQVELIPWCYLTWWRYPRQAWQPFANVPLLMMPGAINNTKLHHIYTRFHIISVTKESTDLDITIFTSF